MGIPVKMKNLLQRTKSNLILQHGEDDSLLLGFIAAAIAYAEEYQHRPEGFYTMRGNNMPVTTVQAIIMLASHFYESRDGSTGGFFGDNVQAGAAVWTVVNNLLRLNREVTF